MRDFYNVLIDFSVRYSPPMSEIGRGILLTRAVVLPFPPREKLSIHSTTMDELGSEPIGFRLTDIIWDMDRRVFLAKTSLDCSGMSLTEIPNDLSRWLDKGWVFGSYVDGYATDEYRFDTFGEPDLPIVRPKKRDLRAGDDDLDALLKVRSSKRSTYFNQIFGTMVRTMAELFNDEATAYAMHKTGMYFSELELREDKTDAARRWRDFKYEYGNLTARRQLAWRARVCNAHHSIKSLVNAIRSVSQSDPAPRS